MDEKFRNFCNFLKELAQEQNVAIVLPVQPKRLTSIIYPEPPQRSDVIIIDYAAVELRCFAQELRN